MCALWSWGRSDKLREDGIEAGHFGRQNKSIRRKREAQRRMPGKSRSGLDLAICLGIWRARHFLRGSGFSLIFPAAGEGAMGGGGPGFAGWAARSSK